MRLPFLLNWYLNPYHAPIMVAKALGFYKEYDIDLAILEPTDPSDVTHIVGKGEIPLGLKAMIHCFAARERGFEIKVFGTLLDEPPTGLISLKEKAINQIEDIRGKRLGYVGEFGKVMIDRLAGDAGINEAEYTLVRVGMDAASAILSGEVDAAIGLSCFQQCEVEDQKPSHLLRLDQLAKLGCCCFCSILFIAHETWLKKEEALLRAFIQATLSGLLITRESPEEAFKILTKASPRLNTQVYKKIFYHLLPFFSKDLHNNERDWQKVAKYAHKLGILCEVNHYQDYYTNALLKSNEKLGEKDVYVN